MVVHDDELLARRLGEFEPVGHGSFGESGAAPQALLGVLPDYCVKGWFVGT